jgi:cation-transporting ATPase 13A2
MKPHNKGDLMISLKHPNRIIAFCGDGTNDCTALKSSDVGLALSEEEASLTAPFNSKVKDISSVVIDNH